MSFPLQPLFYVPPLIGMAVIIILIGLGTGQEKRHKIFLAPLTLIFLWLGFQLIAQASSMVSLLFVQLAAAMSVLMAFAYLIAIRVYTGKKGSTILNILLGGLSVLFAALNLTPWMIQKVTADFDGISIDEAHPLYFLELVLTVGMFSFALFLLLKSTFQLPKKHRAKNYVLFVSTAQAVLMSGLAVLVFSRAAWAQALIFVSGFIFCIGTFFGIFRHQLFDVRPLVMRTVSYAASLLTLAVIYFILAQLLSVLFLQNRVTYDVSLSPFNIIIALLLALLFQPIQLFFNRVTNKFFFRKSYDIDNFYTSLNRKLTSTTDLRRLLIIIANEVGGTLKSEQTFFLIYSRGPRDISAGTGNHSVVPRADAKALDEYFSQKKGESNVVAARLLESRDPIYKLLTSHRVEVVLRLSQNDVTLGYLFLGNHLVSNYTARDIKLLDTIQQELVIAIQNVRSFDEIKELNATLQQRIDSATKELRTSNAQLQRLDEAKDEFISMASHQLRTPLTSIKGYISMLLEGDVGKVTPDQKHLLDEAFISSERMVRLIGDFLNVSRLQTGKFVVEKQPVDLAKVVGQEIDSLLPNAAARGLNFSYKAPKNIPELELDDSKIRQVIMNFADNAIYYSKEKSTIKINLKADKSWVEFTVKDSGIGVPEKEKDQLFNKFFRATNARKQRPDGTGVGLFLAKKVIDAHDGQIIFESKEGRGSTFGFRLPLAKSRTRRNTN